MERILYQCFHGIYKVLGNVLHPTVPYLIWCIRNNQFKRNGSDFGKQYLLEVWELRHSLWSNEQQSIRGVYTLLCFYTPARFLLMVSLEPSALGTTGLYHFPPRILYIQVFYIVVDPVPKGK